MWLGSMRSPGCGKVPVECVACRRTGSVNADPLPDEVPVPDVAIVWRRLVCSVYGGAWRAADDASRSRRPAGREEGRALAASSPSRLPLPFSLASRAVKPLAFPLQVEVANGEFLGR
jgi:hypothetical protein